MLQCLTAYIVCMSDAGMIVQGMGASDGTFLSHASLIISKGLALMLELCDSKIVGRNAIIAHIQQNTTAPALQQC